MIRKAFFSEEKKQKTFTSLSRSSPAVCRQKTKAFWFFFSKKNRFRSLASGFTLLETLVALAIVAIGFAFAFTALPAGLGAQDRAKNLEAAASLAQSLLDMGGQAPAEGQASGFSWRIGAAPLTNGTTSAALSSQAVQVTVRWQEGGNAREIALQSVRLGR